MNLRMAPRKIALLVSLVRGKPVEVALNILKFTPRSAAKPVAKLIRSAVANAQENHGANPDNLRICEIQIGEGPGIKRIQARAMGRANRILKRMSHITVVVEETDGKPAIKAHGTKAKPRPTFAAVKTKPKKKEAAKADAVVETTGEDQATTQEEATE